MMTTTNFEPELTEPRELSPAEESTIDAAVERMVAEAGGGWTDAAAVEGDTVAELDRLPVAHPRGVQVELLEAGVIAAMAERVARAEAEATYAPRGARLNVETTLDRLLETDWGRGWGERIRRGWGWRGTHWKRPGVMALVVSVLAHGVIGLAAGMIVLSVETPRDRRELVLRLDDLAISGSESGDDAALVPAAELLGNPDQPVDDGPAEEPVAAAIAEPKPTATPTEEREVVEVLRAKAERTEGPESRSSSLTETAAVREAVALAIPPMERWVRSGAEEASPARRIEARAGSQAAEGRPKGRADGATTGQAAQGQATAGAGVEFAGVGSSTAQSVVYVVDASGPMVTSLPMVLAEVQRSVGQLSSEQRFSVILFRESQQGASNQAHAERFSDRLVQATPERKRELAAWLAHIEPVGRSNPLIGLEAALELQPEVVFVLSRSVERSAGGVWGQGLSATIERLELLNPALKPDRFDAGSTARGITPLNASRAVQIQTIAFLDDDSTGIMQAIAQRHGPRDGSGYRVVRRSEELARSR